MSNFTRFSMSGALAETKPTRQGNNSNIKVNTTNQAFRLLERRNASACPVHYYLRFHIIVDDGEENTQTVNHDETGSVFI